MMIIGREGADIDDGTIISKKEAGGRGNTAAASATAASSSSWSRLKDPRIVRVSRAFGGKDRHSKVCTVRGLRDRRVRLSVPTAIQLYDLQDRLGLNQPSKVVDWLLNAAKHEIDELPPLQMPPNSSSSSGNFLTHHHHNFQPLMLGSNNSHHHQQLQRPMKIGNNSTNWDGDDDDNDNSILRTKAKEEEEEEDDSAAATRESHIEEEDNNNNNSNHAAFINVSPSNNFFSSRNSSTPPTNGGLGLLNNISSSAHHQSQQQQQQSYSSLMRWDPSTLSLAQSQPQSHPVVTDDFHSNFNVVSLGSGPLHHHHQVLVYQPAAAGGITAAHSYFHSQTNAEYAPKQINFQMLMSSTNANSVDNSNSLTQAANEGSRPFHLTTNFLPTTQKDCGK